MPVVPKVNGRYGNPWNGIVRATSCSAAGSRFVLERDSLVH